MKKLLALCLALALCLCCLASCGSSTVKNQWFSDEILEKCAVPDLPEISDRDYYYKFANGALTFDYIEFKANNAEIREYARAVYNYLAAQDFEYLGTRGWQKSSLAGAFASYYFRDTSSFGECYSPDYAREYIFVYSNDKDASDGLTFNEILISSFDPKTIKYDGKEVIIYDKYDDGLIVTPTDYSLMIFENDYTGTYEFKGTTKEFTWTTLDNTNVQVKFSDETTGTVTLVNDERIRFTYGDITIYYDE